MKDLFALLQGSKTYTLVAVAVFYIAGAKLGFWGIDPEILTLIGVGLAATLRAGISSTGKATMEETADAATRAVAQARTPGKETLNALFLPFAAALSILVAGCAAIDRGQDPIVVNAERSTAVAVDTIDSFLRVEFEQRAVLASISPEIRAAAEQLRIHAPAAIASARSLTRAYKLNRSPENKADLDTAIALLVSMGDQARLHLTRLTQ